MSWKNKVNSSLAQNNYQELTSYLEEKIKVEPDNISYYYYLGLAYFLSDREEEAQVAWFFVFNQQEDKYVRELINVIEIEAQRQLSKGNAKISYSLRQMIQDICPESVNNLLAMVELAIKSNIFNEDYLKKLQLIEAIKKNNQSIINKDYLLKILDEILEFSFKTNIDLVEIILQTQIQKKEIADFILAKARYLSKTKKECFNYAGDLSSRCVQNIPEISKNLSILKDICGYYFSAFNYEKAQFFVDKYNENALTTTQQAFAYYQIIRLMMERCEWLNNENNREKYRNKLWNLVNENIEELEGYIIDFLVVIPNSLLYFYDNPSENRKIFNYCSSLFEKLLRKHYHFADLSDGESKPKQNKKLKIGYIANTFKYHCVGILSRWLINYHDHENFDIHTYLIGSEGDKITEKWFKINANKFTNLPTKLKTIVNKIQEDGIDILVELDSFTHKITQAVMALKPAPIQVSWLGLDSTGIPSIDYFIVDPHVLPRDAQEYYRETLWRLPNTYLAVNGFEVGIPSLTRKDLDIPEHSVVYLSLQTPFKRHPDNIRLQIKILQQVPESYFIVSEGTYDKAITKNVKNLFNTIAQEEGINPQRIILLPLLPLETYRANLTLGDVVLDTYPFNGATTTLDALWLNIPLITKVGKQFHARQGYTFLTNLGITEGIAWTDEEYIKWGVKFGTDEELRKQVYEKLRQSKKTSPLWDGKQFTQDMENTYQEIWSIYEQEEG